MELRFFEWEFGPEVEGVYLEDPEPAGVALRRDLAPGARIARELEARGYFENPLHFKWSTRQKVMLTACSPEEIDEDAVRALRLVVDKAVPEWVAAVKKEAEFYGPDDLLNIEFWSGVPIQAVKAIIENLRERGEL